MPPQPASTALLTRADSSAATLPRVCGPTRAVNRTAIALSLFLRDAEGDPVIPDASRLPVVFPATVEPNEQQLRNDVSLAVSQRPELQQLARLRLEGLVEFRREGKAIYYRLADERARQMIATVYEMFCREDAPSAE